MRALTVAILLVVLPAPSLAHHLSSEANVLPESFKIQQAAQFNFSSSEATVQSERGTLIQLSTATWCGPCFSTEVSLQRILENRSRSEVMLLSYHPDDGMDPFGTEHHNATFYDYYQLPEGYPSTVFGGGYLHDDGSSTMDMYLLGSPVRIDYELDIRRQTDQSYDSNFTITVNGTLDGDTASVDLEIANTESFTGYHEGNLELRVVLFEDDLTFDGGNGIIDHRYTVRTAAADETLDFTDPASYDRALSFDLDPSWNRSNLGVIAYIQMDPAFLPEEIEDPRFSFSSWFASNAMILLILVAIATLLVIRFKPARMAPEEE